MLNMALIPCPVRFSKEIIAVFKMKKSQIDTENDKNPKISIFQRFDALFSRYFERLCGLSVGNGQQGRNVLASVLRKKTNAVLQTKIVRN